ncbi:MAG TPA: lipid-A-disaccharide synthase [Steroidobacteraceae bacterium]|nr:lipid-A-disaccharide synthase [Steroidobacteraceae bacterium]
MRIALVAGETSGDALGAALIEALRRRFPDAQFAGVAGPKMRAAGCVAWHDIDELAVMGLTEVITHLPRLMRLRAALRRQILEFRPDVFVGVDYKEFNLGLARQLKRAGLTTVQYVSPQVWAWRQGRVRTIGESVDLVLCLFPFEPAFYREHGVSAAFVGHPLADQIPMQVDRAAARAELGIDTSARVLAVLPGSRRGEVEKLAGVFAGAAELLGARFPGLVSVAPMVTPALGSLFAARSARHAPNARIRLLDGQARVALAAADVVLVASGTATLETALSGRPMVVAYRLGFITAFLLRTLGLVKIKHFSQPNLLAGTELVPEFFQEAASPENLANALARWLEQPAEVARVSQAFAAIHARLRCDGAERAAAEIVTLLATRAVPS